MSITKNSNAFYNFLQYQEEENKNFIDDRAIYNVLTKKDNNELEMQKELEQQ
jgi:hypothetical protein